MNTDLIISYLYFMGAIAPVCWSAADDPKRGRFWSIAAAIGWPITVPIAVIIILVSVAKDWRWRRR